MTLAYVLSLVAVTLAFFAWADRSLGELLAAAVVDAAALALAIVDGEDW